MARSRLFELLRSVLFYGYGLFTLFLYVLISIQKGTFFKRPTEKEKLELRIARDRFWNLSKDCSGLSHHFLTLRSGFKFHYVSNYAPGRSADKPLVVFIHGFPDSWAIWRHIVSSHSLQKEAVVVAVDLPGYGGSGTMDEYTATNVLESLAEFIIAIRAQYGIDTETETNQRRVVIVGHDWGCVLAMRLAADAPQLGDRFILTNGPLPRLAAANIRRLLSSSWKMIKTSGRTPIRSRSTLLKAAKTLIPVFRQLILSGYVFAIQLPMVLVEYLGHGGNHSFLKAAHRGSCGNAEFTPRDAAECMASSLGPSVEECKTATSDGDEYPESVKKNRTSSFRQMACYYRQGAAFSRWEKSLETIAYLHSLSRGVDFRRTSSGAGLFDGGPEGFLKAHSTIIWGRDDIALEPQLCLDGISDYLIYNSQVVELPRSGHFTPMEPESQLALEKAVEWAVKGEKEDIGAVIGNCYQKAVVTVRR